MCSVRLSVRPGLILENKSLEKKSYLRNCLTQGHQTLCIDVIKRSKVKRLKVKGHKRSRSKVNVAINVKEKAGGLRPTSSILSHFLRMFNTCR